MGLLIESFWKLCLCIQRDAWSSAVHAMGHGVRRRFPCRAAEAVSHGPCDHRVSPVARDAPSVQFLEVIDTPVVLVTTGACVGPDSAEIHRGGRRKRGRGEAPEGSSSSLWASL